MTNEGSVALIGLGSNKSFRGMTPEELLAAAAEALRGCGSEVTLSPVYRSPAWPDPKEPEYRNAVARLVTALEPLELLHALQAIETRFGRVRSDDPSLRYAPRTLDLDLLGMGMGMGMGREVLESEALTLPHPRLAERDFVLLPLRDLVPDFVHPVTGADVAEMIADLPEITARPL